MTHNIHLYGNHYRVVSDTGYQHYLRVLEEISVCQHCQRSYTQERPQIYENTCLSCFLAAREGIQYIGPLDSQSPLAGPYTHRFLLKAQCRVHLTQKNDTDWKENDYETLRYYGYPLPPLEHKGQHLEAYDWTIRGEVTSAKFLFVTRHYSPYVVFLVYKGGKAREFSMHLKADRQMYNQAKEHLQAVGQRTAIESGEVYSFLSMQLSVKFSTGLWVAAEPAPQDVQ